MSNLDRLEVLAPAGDMECLKAAVDYGADAVYVGGNLFGMRAAPQNFNPEELKEAAIYCHERGVKIYLTCNTLPRNNEIPYFEDFINGAVEAKVDAVIVNDIGILTLVKKYAPDMEIHISTQAGIVNYATANAFYEMGAKRVVLARELSLDEIAEIRAKTPKDLEIEVFVHGAMCVSFSGRCLISNYLTDRDPNRGACSQPCRWNYYLMEERRPGEYYQVFEDDQGSYILNAKDMCMIEYLDKLAEAGVNSFKIEGRAKSSYYVSVVTNAYRMAMDVYKENPNDFKLPEWIRDEVYKISHRPYCTGYFFNHPHEVNNQYYESSGYIRECDVVAIVDYCENGRIYASQKNKFNAGDEIEILSPGGSKPVKMIAEKIYNGEGEEVLSANHATMKLSIPSDLTFPKNSIIRVKKND